MTGKHAGLIAAAPDLLAALQSLQSFVAIMIGRGPDAEIPDTIPTPLGVPVKIGAIMRDVAAAIAKASTPLRPVMTDHAELIAELLAEVRSDGDVIAEPSDLDCMAADAIASLTKQVERLTRELDDALATIALLQSQYRKQQDHDTAVIKRLEQVRDGAIAANKATAAAIEAEVSHLRAENEKLREALKSAASAMEAEAVVLRCANLARSCAEALERKATRARAFLPMHHREQIDEISAALESKE